MYLLLYNGVCFSGWLWVLAQTLLFAGQTRAPAELYQAVTPVLHITQTLAVLEVVHAAAGLVRTPVMTAAQQVASRIFIVWGILHLVPEAAGRTLVAARVSGHTVGLNLYTLLLAWAVTEVIRYAFYAAKELGSEPFILTYPRYTTFIGLYPLGVASELALVWLALPAIRQRRLLSYPMPNPLNMSIDYHAVCLLVMLCYAPGFPPMYMHMWRQRRKVLGRSGAGKDKAA